jgi:hypothetical protein
VSTGRHYQNAYVTRNVDKAVAGFKQYADLRALMEIEVAVQMWTPRGEGRGVQKLAFAWVGDLNYELIEPKEGDALAIYRDALPTDDRLVFHHVCHLVDDFDALMARVEKQPFPVVLKGGSPGMLEFVYVDTRRWLGHYTEYVWMGPERWAAMGGR